MSAVWYTACLNLAVSVRHTDRRRRLVEMLDWTEAAQAMQIPRALEDLLQGLEREMQQAQVQDLPAYMRIAELVRQEVRRVA
jgi:hypothetical protein